MRKVRPPEVTEAAYSGAKRPAKAILRLCAASRHKQPRRCTGLTSFLVLYFEKEQIFFCLTKKQKTFGFSMAWAPGRLLSQKQIEPLRPL
jgi:hypothetical protein